MCGAEATSRPELNHLIPGIAISTRHGSCTGRDREYHDSRCATFCFVAVSFPDGTLRILALLTCCTTRAIGADLLRNPEGGVASRPHQKQARSAAKGDIVTDPAEYDARQRPTAQPTAAEQPFILVLSALVDANLRPSMGAVLFADTTAVVTDPAREADAARRAFGPFSRPQASCSGTPRILVSSPISGARKVLDTVAAEG